VAQHGLGAEQLAGVFPFHLVLDRSLRVTQVGPTLARICPAVCEGALGSAVRIRRPVAGTYEQITAQLHSTFVLEVAEIDLLLKGQMLLVEGGDLLFLGSPWVTEMAQMRRLGLALNDFAIHDPVVDYLFLLQVQQTALADAQKLAVQLDAQRAELRAANRGLAEQAAQLEAANRDLESFSYSVSHDLRAPLRAMSAFATMLAEEHGETLEPEAQHLLRRIRHNARQMGALVDDLLAFSRMGRQEIRRRRVDLSTLVREVFDDLRAEHQGRHLEVEISELPACEGDPSLLRQVLLNLVGNALKFTRGRDVARIAIGTRRDGGETVVFVRDNGVGFSMEYAHKLFGVFQRLHTSEQFEGTGVGLAIVQRIVQRHGWRVWAESVPGEGATFFIGMGGEAEG
jgi:signal transduction histidine kinase